MKLTTFILMITLLQVSGKGFGQKINLNVTNGSPEKILESIRDQSGYEFFYNVKDLKNRKVSLYLKNVSVEDAVKAFSKDLSLSYQIQMKTIVLSKKEKTYLDHVVSFFTDSIPIQGKVTDSLGNPLEGATIYVIAKSVSTNDVEKRIVVGKDGGFKVAAGPGYRLIISYIGYATQSIVIKKEMPFQNIVLRKITQELSEVMVQTGYQTLSKESATGSFGKPDMKVFSRRTGTLDVVGRLEGQVPGLQIAISRDGNNLNNINLNGSGVTTRRSLIRGMSSVQNGTPPLYVVNGVIVDDFSSVNPDDIEDITVLKDAAASSIWGARSASGVIVIKTKSGAENEKVSFFYSGFMSYKPKPDFSYSNMLNSRQYIDVAKEIFDPVAYSWESQMDFIAPHDQILYDQYRHLITSEVASHRLDSLAAINNRSQLKDLYRSEFTRNSTVSASGGNKAYSFYASLGYSGSGGGLPGLKNDAYKINVSQNINAGRRIKLSLNTSLVNVISSSQNPVEATNAFLPYQLFRDAAGNSLNMNYRNGYTDSLTRDYQARSRINLDYNPLNETGLTHSNSNNLNINITANATVSIWKGLKFSGTYGYVRSPGVNESFVDHRTISERRRAVRLTEAQTVDDNPVYNYPLSGSSFTRTEYDQRNWTVRNQLVYDGRLKSGRDKFSVQIGQEVQQSDSHKNTSRLVGYDAALGTYASLDNTKLQDGILGVSGFGFFDYTPYATEKVVNRFISYYALASYLLDNKFGFNASLRQDFSNQFASEVSTQNKPVWSIGGKWHISNERFMEPVKWVNNLGLRITYGITGNSPYLGGASQFDIVDPLTNSNNYYYKLIAGDAFTISSVANKTLAWESTANLNIGVDYSIFKNRISGSIDAYRRVTTDLIGRVKLNPFTGYLALTGNIGKLVNSGIEFSLRTQNILTKDFSWSSGFNIGFNRNKLVSYSTPSASANTVSARMGDIPVIGYPLNPLWAYRYAGLNHAGTPQIYLSDNSIITDPNAAQVEDIKYMGTTTPVASGGFSNNFTYKSFSVSANMIFNLGGVMRQDVNSFYSGKLAGSSSFGSGNISTYFLNRWKKPGDEAFTDIPPYFSSLEANGKRNVSYYTYADMNVVSASYVTIRDITFSYELKSELLKALRIDRASAFIQATNFLVWVANDQGLNPELPAPSSGAIPVKHTYSLGINLSF